MLFSDFKKSCILRKIALPEFTVRHRVCQDDEFFGRSALRIWGFGVFGPHGRDEIETMRHSTLGIAAAFLLIGSGVGIRLFSQNNSNDCISSDQQALAVSTVSTPSGGSTADDLPVLSDETHYLIRGQDPVQPPNLLRTSSPKPLPPNPLRSGEQSVSAAVNKLPGDIRLAADPSPSSFELPSPPESTVKSQDFDDLPPPSQDSLLEAAGFPPAAQTEAPPVPARPLQPLPLSATETLPNSFAETPTSASPTPVPLPSALPPVPPTNPFSIPNTPTPPPPPVNEALSSITAGESLSPTPTPTPLQSADPFGENSQTVAVPPPKTAPSSPVHNDSRPPFGRAAESSTIANNYPSARNTIESGGGNMEGTGTPGPSALEGSQTPHITIEKVLPAEVVVDQPMTIKTVLRNVGRSSVKDIVLRDRVPQGTRLLSTAPEGTTTASGELIWSLGNLNANEQIAVEMRILPYREGEIGSVASVGYTAEASVRIAVTRPMLQVEVKAPQEVQLGQTANLEITISNPGSATATGVVLTAYVPEGFYHKDGKTLENRNIDTLKPKESKKLILPLTCTGPGVLVNRLVVKANGNLSVEEKTTIRALSPMLNLEIIGPKQRFLERKAGYRLVVSNPGTASAKNVDLVVYLPTALQFVSTNQSGVYEKSTHTVHWSLEELPPQEAGEIELVVLPIKSGDHTIRFAGNGQSGLKAEETQSLSVDGLAALSFEVACLSNLIEVGRDTVYEIRVSNRGTKSSGNVVVTANLSEGMNYVSAEGPVRHQSNAGVVLFEPLAQLESKGEKVYRITAKCLADGDHRISVKVQSDELRAPITKEESTRVFK